MQSSTGFCLTLDFFFIFVLHAYVLISTVTLNIKKYSLSSWQRELCDEEDVPVLPCSARCLDSASLLLSAVSLFCRLLGAFQ